MADFYYKPDDDTFLLIDATSRIIENERILVFGEIGCGSGEAIVQLLEKTQAVLSFATDLNVGACRFTKRRVNGKFNSNIQVIASDLANCFRPLGGSTLLIFNPPYLPENKEEDELLDKNELIAFVGGKQGWEIGFRFAKDAAQRLRVPSIVVFSTIAISETECLEMLSSLGDARTIARKKLGFEELFAVLIRPSNSNKV